MGFMKRLSYEQEASGFSTDRYFDNVCRLCIDNPALAVFVARSTISMCHFCGSTNELGMKVGNLFHYMAECLEVDWDDPNHVLFWEDGEFVVPLGELLDSDELLGVIDEPLLHEDLRQEFTNSFKHQWCCSPWNLEPWEVILYSWSNFAEVVKTKRRFLTQRGGMDNGAPDIELLSIDKVLDAIGDVIRGSNQRVLKRSDDLRITRARMHEPNEILGTAETLGSPPLSRAKHNRMSGEGISMFYGAEDADTAIAEIRSNSNQAVTVGIWTPTRELVYLDLLAAQPIPSIFDIDERFYRTELRFLVEFADDLAKPIDNGVDYIPTQIVTEYIRDNLKTEDGHPIDAIRYGSASDEGGVCWVVFAGPNDCGDEGDSEDLLLVLDPKSVKRYDWVLQQM